MAADQVEFHSVDNPIPVEADIVLQLCRPRPSAAQWARAEHLLEHDLDWGRIIDHATRHRVLPAVWSHIFRLAPHKVDRMHSHLARAVISYNAVRAEVAQYEFRKLRAAFAERGLPALVRKGLYLASAVYPDPSWRFMEDIDLLVHQSDRAEFKQAMQELGYSQGEITGDDGRIKPIGRSVEAFWLVHTSSLPAFHKPMSGPVNQALHVDLRHHILEPAAGKTFDIDAWFARGRVEWLLGGATRLLSREDFFIDLCVHLYREAVTLSAIERNKDLLLTRFVDVAEVLASREAAPDPEKLVEIVRDYTIGPEVYFALHLTEELLPGSTDPALRAELDPGDHAYLHEYGALDGQPGVWKDAVASRVFDYQRRKDVTGRSRLPR